MFNFKYNISDNLFNIDLQDNNILDILPRDLSSTRDITITYNYNNILFNFKFTNNQVYSFGYLKLLINFILS